jgi:serine carboxypeptidase-like clade 2
MQVDCIEAVHDSSTQKKNNMRACFLCSDPILNSYNFTVFSVLPIYSKLIKAGLRVWLYSGDADGRVPVIGSRYCVESLDLPIKTQWQPWYLDKQV